jgi:hypothetical protein
MRGWLSWSPPTPFVRVLDFLPSDIHSEVRAMAVGALPRFVASGVYDECRGRIGLPYVEEAVERCGVAGVLGVHPIGLQRYELQVTHHGDAAFFEAHVDNGNEINGTARSASSTASMSSRSRFGGGSLLLFDADLEAERYSSGSFTTDRANEQQHRLPSKPRPREVERVTVETGEPADGRFSLNGWIGEAHASSL